MADAVFAEWTPDQPPLGAGAIEALNAIAAARGYRPFPSWGASSTTPLAAKCQGAGAFGYPDGTVVVFAGDTDSLYSLADLIWTDITRFATGVKDPYSTAANGRWVFTAFGDFVIATNGVDPLQKFDTGFPIFENLAGSPPVGRYLAVCKDYVIVGRLSTDVTAVQWCDTNNAEAWDIGSGGGDIQPIPDCGQVTGLVGGDFFLVFLERGVQRFDFVGGDIVFQRRELSRGVGCSIPGTVQGFNDRAFFWHNSGFYQCVGGSVPVPIGLERVNRYFRRRLLQGGEDFVFSAIDSRNNLYVVGIPTTSSDGYPIDELLVYKWDIGENGQWTHVIDGSRYECLFNAVTPGGTTLEDLDGYGSLEAVPFSLDSDAWIEGTPELAAFRTDHNSGWFASGNMRATLTTTEAQLVAGQKALVRGYRPMVEGAALSGISGTVLGRDTLSVVPVSNPNSQDKAPRASGLIRARIKARYHRAQIVIDDLNWTAATGISEIEAYPVGGG